MRIVYSLLIGGGLVLYIQRNLYFEVLIEKPIV